MNSNIFDRLSFLSLFMVVVLLPIFFLPFTNIPVETSKGLLLVVGLAVCVIFWAIARFSDGQIVFPKSWILVSGLGIVLAFLLSTIFSGNSQISSFGTMFDIGSFWFILAGFILMFMSSVIFRTTERAKAILFGIILSSAVVVVFQSIHLFMPNILSLGVLSGKTGNVLGSWNALSIFAGFSVIASVLVIEFISITKTRKLLLEIFLLFSVLLLAAVNFPLAWVLLGISCLIIFVYKTSTAIGSNGEEGGKKQFPLIPLFIMIVSLLFFISPNFFGSFISNRLQISNNEISPSFSATMSTTKEVLSRSPIFGIGPNRFGDAWSMYKPESINKTQFWDSSFDSGFGLLPTLTTTTGGLGILAWAIFLLIFLFTDAKSVFSSVKKRVNLEMVIFFTLSLYLLISSFFYFTGSVVFLLALAFIGMFVGLSASIDSNKEISMSFLSDPRKSFFSILSLVLIIILSVIASFKYTERFASVFYFGKAVFATTEKTAEDSIIKALSLYQNDLYLRTFSQINLVKLNSITKKGSALSDTDKADLQTSLDKAISSAQLATTFDSKNHLNFQTLGSIYMTAASLGVKDSNGKAIETYQIASTLNPFNPGIKLAMAQASFIDGKVKEAKDYANTALSLKPDYADALIFLSQIAKSEGDTKNALSYAESALLFTPSDKNLIQYIDSLKSPASSISSPDSNKSKQ